MVDCPNWTLASARTSARTSPARSDRTCRASAESPIRPRSPPKQDRAKRKHPSPKTQRGVARRDKPTRLQAQSCPGRELTLRCWSWKRPSISARRRKGHTYSLGPPRVELTTRRLLHYPHKRRRVLPL